MSNPPVRLPDHDERFGRTGLVVDRIATGVRVTPVFDPDIKDGDPCQSITLSSREALRMAWNLVKFALQRVEAPR